MYLILWSLQLVVEGLTVFSIWRLNMLPDQYMIMLIAVFLLLWCLTGLLLLLPAQKKNGGKIRRGIACVLTLVIVLVCALVVTVTSDVYKTLHAVTNPGEEKPEASRSIYVLANDPAQSMEDLKGYPIALVENYDTGNVEQVLDQLRQILGSVETVRTESLLAQVDALYAGTAKAVIVNDANLSGLEDVEGYEDFSDKARLLCQVAIVEVQQTPVIPEDPTEPGESQVTDPTVDVEQTEPTEETEPTSAVDSQITAPVITGPDDITKNPFLVYISGSDTRSNILSNSRCDVNILAVVNPTTKQVLLISTPRDYYISNPAGNGAKDKLTHCGNFGISNSVEVLEGLYQDRISYYAQINFKGFETFIDAIGGVTVYSDVSFKAATGDYFTKGENVMDGAKALAFARERYNLSGGDNARAQNQMKVIKAVIQKVTSGTTIISRYSEILDSLSGMFRTNISMEEMGALVKMQLGDMASWEVLSYSAQGTNAMRTTYSMPGVSLSVQLPVQESLDHAITLIDRMISGEVLTEDDLAY